MFKICQFYVNNRSGHLEQLSIAIEMIKKGCNGKIDEGIENIVDT